MPTREIKDFNIQELEEFLISCGQRPFHSRQIFSWLYKKGARDFNRMSDLPVGLRQQLKESFSFLALELIQSFHSSDGTEKFLFTLGDGNLIEAVSIPASGRVTGCISSQAGCRFACNFCASGLYGFKRNLTCAEMLDEALFLKDKSGVKKLTHIVFMGIGEPLDNYDNLLKAIRIINSKEAFNIASRRITISTCGVIPGIKRLAGEGLQVELSVSLHAADDKTRSRLMPANKIYPLKKLLGALHWYIAKTGRQVTFEYVLFKDINSSLQNAANLSTILRGLNCKVNLIPANPVAEKNILAPEKKEILVFRDYLVRAGTKVTLRKQRGADIQASCGQLRLRYA